MPINSLPVSPNQVDSDAMRTKINELISDNSSVTVGDAPPASPGEGDLWFDEGAASMYVYVASPTNAWIQTNPAGGAGGSAGASIPVEFTGYATGPGNTGHSEYVADTTLVSINVDRQRVLQSGVWKTISTTSLVFANGMTQVISNLDIT